MKYLIGLDLGTTNAKGVLYDERGTAIAAAVQSYDTFHEGNKRAEQEAIDWWNATQKILLHITESVDEIVRNSICSICISSQTPTLLPLDIEGNPLRRAIIWMDGRADKELELILDELGRDRYMEITGMIPASSFLPPKLLWYKNHEPELFAKTNCFLQVNGYINYRLTGKLSMDLDQASLTQCLDVKSGSWSEEIEDAVGIKFSDYLPDPVSNTTVIGHVTKEASKVTGLPVGVIVSAGSSDAVAALYASGMTEMGEAVEVSGTSSLVFAGTNVLPEDAKKVSAQRCSLDQIPYVYNVPITATGASVKWYLSCFGNYEEMIFQQQGITVYDSLNQEAMSVSPGSKGLMFFPYLMGERAPLWNDYAKGMFIGLSMETKREDIIRSIFEGTAYALKSVIEEFNKNGTEIRALRVVGGGSLSETWLKIKAAILGIPILILDKKTMDVPFGDALIAGISSGVYADLTKTIKEIVKVERCIEPDPKWVKLYRDRYPYFKRFYTCLDQSLQDYDRLLQEEE